MGETTRVAILDGGGRLVGYDQVSPEEGAEGCVVVGEDCDLPTDGSYRWDGERFMPLGHGFDRVNAAPCSTEEVLAHVVAALLNAIARNEAAGIELPQQCIDWKIWYDQTLKVRHEEQAQAKRLRATR